jgi:thymidine phosphorylase
MNQVLGSAAGNALEVKEAVEWLAGAYRNARLDEVVYALGAEMLVLGGIAADLVIARQRLERAHTSGDAAERFQQMVDALGTVTAVDTRAVGLVVVTLGGGRTRVEDAVDHAVGLTEVAGPGDRVGSDVPLAVIHARTTAAAEQASRELVMAFTVGDESVVAGPVVAARITT